MRTEFVYSIIAMGAIPVVANAATAQNISSDALVSVDGTKITYPVGKLVPGSYTFSAKLTSKVYDVKVKIAGADEVTVKSNGSNPADVEIDFKLTEETDVELELVSTDPGESGAGWTVADAVVILNTDIAAIKSTLSENANTLATTISGYNYAAAAKQEDVDAANALKTKADGIDKDSYDDYKKYELYADKSTIQKEIDALSEKAAKAEAEYQNEQAYNRVNSDITAIKAKYNAAVAGLKEKLVNQAAYLLDGALADLDENINKEITAATQDSYASYQKKTAAADEVENKSKIPTEKAINDIVADWEKQGTTNQTAYDDLHKVVTGLQDQLNAVTVADASLTETFAAERATAQEAINAINTKVENAKNSAAQLTLNVDDDKTAAQAKINTLTGKVNTANAEFNANKKTTEDIAAVQKAYNDAKNTVDAKVSKDGDYKAADYYADYLKTQQDAIDKLTSDAAAAYKVDGTGTAQTYNADLAAKTAPITTAIDNYKTNAVAAVEKYDALQTAMTGYQTDLDAARAKVEGLAVYTADGYDYKTKFDLLQKRIKDINKAIKAAQEKVGEEHWTAMIAIDADAKITTDISDLLTNVQADQNQYDADFLANGMTTLEDKITAFKAKDASVLGNDVTTFQDVESDIEAAYTAVKDAKGAINAQSETVDYTAKVGTEATDWSVASGNNYNRAKLGNGQVEHYGETAVGDMIWQEVSVENGIYDIEVLATSHNANGGASLEEDAKDVAYVFGKSGNSNVHTWITARKNNGFVSGEPETYEIKGVKVENGKLTIGLHNNVAGKTNWHTIQIKSLKANTASLIQGWGKKVDDLNKQQTALETTANAVAAKVAANTSNKTTLATNIGDNTATPKTGMWKSIDDFKTLYNIGKAESTLGNRGKADGEVTKAVTTLEEDLTALQAANTAVDPTKVTNYDDKTSSVNKKKAADGWTTGLKKTGNFRDWTVGGIESVEHWVSADDNAETGVVFAQTVNNLPNGIYDIELYANAVDQKTAGKNGAAYVYANDEQASVTITDNGTANSYPIKNVVVLDGTLKIGMMKTAAGTNWHSIQIKSLKYHENSQDALYNNTDAENPGLNNRYTKLNETLNELKEAAPGIKTAVENNAKANTDAQKAVADLGTYELDNLKSLADVSKADASYNGKKGNAVRNEDVTGWENFYVYQSGLDADKSYNSEKGAVDATIAAMTAAINAANADETLPYPWKDEITVVTTPDDPATEANEEVKTNYKVSEIKAAIDAIKTEAASESSNYWAYRNIYSGKNSVTPAYDKALAAVKANEGADLKTAAGDGALAYYQGVVAGYETEFANIEKAMRASIYARTAVADADTHKANINALTKKLNDDKNKTGVLYDAKANLAKYNEQVKEYTETQTLWNSTYTEIAATDQSSKVQEWLDELDAIQVDLTAATKAVEDNYKVGKSVAEAKDFAAIKARINDVKARQSEAYVAQITEDNKVGHESFMGNETKKGTIQLAEDAYKNAVKERAEFSSTNEDVKAAIDKAAAELDEALYSCPDEIAELKQQENETYAATQSPDVFDVDPFNKEAENIAKDINDKLAAFKNVVKTAINDDVWTPAKAEYVAEVKAAKDEIAGYSDDAKKDAFKDVEDLIAKGDAGVAAYKLSEVEAAIAGLEDIDDMLAADKDAAAEKDINAALTVADNKYTEVQTYISGVSDNIGAKSTQSAALEEAYADVKAAKELDKNFENHNAIVAVANDFITTADGCKTTVKTAVDNDAANTAAYNEMVEALAPVEAKLAEAKAAASAYKYPTSFENEEALLEGLKDDAEDSKAAGTAVGDKADFIVGVGNLDASIDATLTAAFGNEKTGLAADITELKNQYNTYVAANGLDAATAYKKDIDELEKALGDAAIKDADDPEDGLQYDEILDATNNLVALQESIATKESELLAANGKAANADAMAELNGNIAELEQTASLEGYDEWVAEQPYGDTTLGAAIEALKTQIDDVKTAVNAEPNIAFYKDQYQKKIDDIKKVLKPVADEIAAKDKQFKDNAAAYERLTAEITEMQAQINAAKEKVGAYEYAADNYKWMIEQYYNEDDPTELTGGAQYDLNLVKNYVDEQNANKTVHQIPEATVSKYRTDISNSVQNYLDQSAKDELDAQADNLTTLLYTAVDAKYKKQTYSSVLWARLVAEQKGIAAEIDNLEEEIYTSYQTSKWDEEQQTYVPKDRTSDADYETQIAKVNSIKEEIANLGDAVDNLNLLGDANVDGRVNVLDYQKVLNMILDPTQQPEEGTDLFTNIDINQSEVIEVGDLTAIVNYILDGDWQGFAAARSMNRGGNENLSLSYSSVSSSVQRIAVNLENANNYTAFQMDVVLPDGMKIVGTSLSSRAGESHKLYSRTQLDGSVRMLVSSVNGEAFSGNEGAVLYIDVEGANANSVEILNILFSDVNANTREFKLGSSVTGIDAIGSTFDALKQKVYDLGGRVMNGVKKGINIIRNADGSTKKVAE